MNKIPSAKDLFLSYLQNLGNPSKIIDLFHQDAAIEIPYLQSLGMPWQWKGRDTILAFLQGLPSVFSGFIIHNIHMHIDTPGQAFGEYEVQCTVVATGLPYHQRYMGRLVAENGKILLIREALDMAEVAKSMFPK
ncbi:MAG TPA: nuclear transport factor 2 family protein [Chitinophagaceae bacterium]|nr:nuclear transport factor 2 family protein [Chitinophagaceae bacterium]